MKMSSTCHFMKNYRDSKALIYKRLMHILNDILLMLVKTHIVFY